MAGASVAPPCSFFARGACRNGDQCRFSHAAPAAAGTPPSPAKQAAPCSFFARGACANANCRFSHAAPPPPVVVVGRQVSSGRALCSFFARGACRDGDACRFSHDAPANKGSSQPPTPPHRPPPALIHVPDGAPVFSIDVECVASGPQHHDRVIGSIALVNHGCEEVLHLLVLPDVPVASYLTPLTGLTAERLQAEGRPLAEALGVLRDHLPPQAVLVGQNINKDVEWLGLKEGTDFAMQIDLAALLRPWNTRFGSYSYFGQDHYAHVWLGEEHTRAEGDAHDALQDATVSMRLFRAYVEVQHDADAVAAHGARALAVTPKPSFAKLHPTIDGCCMGNKQTCTCGAPFFS
mmetsp:Transcript_12324/g.39678  ORF Transcript_12324/g.39678 Transcript_12324/m.39678 type:complete len:350 (+) Transcript_12324:574-1623(+)